jgi:uncharacterized protein YoxC
VDKDLMILILVGFCVIIAITCTILCIYILKINNFKKLKKDIVTFSDTLHYLKTDVSNSYNILLSDIKATKKDYIFTLEGAKKEVKIISNRLELLITELNSILIDNNKVSQDYLLKKYPENRANFNIKVKPNNLNKETNLKLNKEITIGDLVNKNKE